MSVDSIERKLKNVSDRGRRYTDMRPSATSLTEGEEVISNVNGVITMYRKQNGKLYKVNYSSDGRLILDEKLVDVQNDLSVKRDLKVSGNIGVGTSFPDGNLHISSLADATLILEADTDDTTEGDNPRIELIQDGGNVHGFLGIEGDAGSLYTDSLANAVYLESKNITTAGSKIQFVTGGDYDATDPVVKGTARMTITGTGIALIGRTSPAATTKDPLLEIDGNISFDGFIARAGTGGSNNGGNVFNFFWDGSEADIYIDTTGIATGHTTSDYRMKENVTTINDDVLNKINALRPISYTQKEFSIFKQSDKQRIGFIAHEIQDKFPDIVKGDKDGVGDDDDPIIQSIDNHGLVAYLIKAVQELSAKVTVLENN